MISLNREQVLVLIREHLADELDLDSAAIIETTRFKEDLEADSLDLYTLVQELEDTYGVAMSDEQAARDPDGGGGCRLRARQRPHGRCRARIATETTMLLAELLDEAAGGSGAPGLHARLMERAAAGTPTRVLPSSATASSHWP